MSGKAKITMLAAGLVAVIVVAGVLATRVHFGEVRAKDSAEASVPDGSDTGGARVDLPDDGRAQALADALLPAIPAGYSLVRKAIAGSEPDVVTIVAFGDEARGGLIIERFTTTETPDLALYGRVQAVPREDDVEVGVAFRKVCSRLPCFFDPEWPIVQFRKPDGETLRIELTKASPVIGEQPTVDDIIAIGERWLTR